jgi:PAS domain-containing protein
LAYIEDVPKDYIQISSGLGETKPKSLILLPLESHGDINGIIEIASIKSMEEYELEFLKLAASNISTGITEVLTNMETRQLLEQSQQQAEELSAQEEEMRQNLEELQTTQEEAYRREIELKGSLKAFQNALAFAEFDKEGKLTEMNGPMQDLLRINDALDFLGHDFVEIFGIKSNDFRQYKEIFTSLKSGILDLTLGSILSKDISNIGVVVSGVEDESGKIIKAKFIVQNEFKIEKGGNKALNDKIAELENELEKYQNISNKIEQTKKNLSR